MKKIIFVLVIISGILLTACYEKPGPGTGIVKVIDTNYNRVSVANVKLYQGDFENVGLTNTYGEYSYTHDPALEVIFFIDVTSSAGSGIGQIRIIPGKTTTETVMVY